MGKKIIGYENPGGDPCKIRAVHDLTDEERKTRAAYRTLYSRLLRAEKAKKEAQDDLQALRERCAHRVFGDAEGLIYHSRTCTLCGADLGFV